MSYTCECGNKDEFLETFDIAIDVVDGKGNFVRLKDRNVSVYLCAQCRREISYEEFWAEDFSSRTDGDAPPP